MQERLTISAARNIFFGGTIFFFVVFGVLVVQSVYFVNDTSSNPSGISKEVALGKEIWERHSCINCHTLLGEGAYYAPELGNVWVRRGGIDDPEGASDFIKEWIKAQPTGIEGRRQMPHYDLTDDELEGLVQFFKWTSEINTQNWPPNDAG